MEIQIKGDGKTVEMDVNTGSVTAGFDSFQAFEEPFSDALSAGTVRERVEGVADE